MGNYIELFIDFCCDDRRKEYEKNYFGSYQKIEKDFEKQGELSPCSELDKELFGEDSPPPRLSEVEKEFGEVEIR